MYTITENKSVEYTLLVELGSKTFRRPKKEILNRSELEHCYIIRWEPMAIKCWFIWILGLGTHTANLSPAIVWHILIKRLHSQQ